MELNINSPIYYKDQYGVDSDIYSFCQQAHDYFKDKKYSELLSTIGIIPILAPLESYKRGEYKEQVSMICGNSVASICIQMDLEEYLAADETGKRLMYKKMIIDAVKKVKRRGMFDYKTFCEDLDSFVNTGFEGQ